MDLKVKVVTADGVPIPRATVSVGPAAAVQTDQGGLATFGTVATPLFIRASMPNYLDQSINISVSKQGAITWTDPGSTVAVQRGATVSGLTITIPLGRMKPAATVPMDDLLRTFAKAIASAPKKMDVGTHTESLIPLPHTWTTSENTYNFLPVNPAAIHDEETRKNFFKTQQNRWKANFWAATNLEFVMDPKLKPTTNNAKNGKPEKGWSAFIAKPKIITPQMESNFTYVEWTDPSVQENPNAIRYLIGLWRPRSSTVYGGQRQDVDANTTESKGEGRDVMVFISPDTSEEAGFPKDRKPYHSMYPYGAKVQVTQGPREKVPELTQPYIRLGAAYLYTAKFMVHQMLAAEKDALVIFPIQPSEHWEDLARLEGISRLAAESLLFEHRRFPKKDIDIALDHAPPLGPQEAPIPLTYLPPPPLRYAAISAFSSGMGNVKSLMHQNMTWKTGSARTWAQETQNPHFASADTFVAAWREIWDIDGSHNVLGPWGRWAATCHSWQRDYRHIDQKDYTTDRICRLYHSEYTMESAMPTNQMMMALGDRPGHFSPATPQSQWRVVWGSNGSVVYLSKSFVFRGEDDNWRKGEHSAGSDSPDNPEFWRSRDEHQVMPIICFAHAAANSKIRKLELRK